MALIESADDLGTGTVVTAPNDPLRLTVWHSLEKATHRATLQFEACNQLPFKMEGITIRSISINNFQQELFLFPIPAEVYFLPFVSLCCIRGMVFAAAFVAQYYYWDISTHTILNAVYSLKLPAERRRHYLCMKLSAVGKIVSPAILMKPGCRFSHQTQPIVAEYVINGQITCLEPFF